MADQHATRSAASEPVAHHVDRPAEHAYQKCIRSSDGKIIHLVTYSFEDPSHLQETSKWLRLGKPPSRVPSRIHVMNWALSAMSEDGGSGRIFTPASIVLTCLKLSVASPLMLFMSTEFGAKSIFGYIYLPKLNSRYELVRCSNKTPKRLRFPSPQEINSTHATPSYLDPIQLQPSLVLPGSAQPSPEPRVISVQAPDASNFLPARYLCIVRDFDTYEYETVNVSDYIIEHGDEVDLEFVFVSYTRMHFRVATDEEIDNFEYPDEETRAANRELAHRDRKTLASWGIKAAREAGKKAFWIDFECIQDADGVARAASGSDDVYRIGDVVRIAHSIIIALGPPASEKVQAIISDTTLPDYKPQNKTTWLRQWGSRLWTLPELLLCPSEHRIKVHVLGDPSEPKAIAKRNFVARAWDDAEEVNELVNHFEGSAVLSQLQLLEAALACFSRRETAQFSGGDIAYAIMGLLPHKNRPKVNKTDSSFQAFAKLSLAGGNSAFMERLMCLYRPGSNTPWHDTRDFWGTRLARIDPMVRILRVLESDAVILSGAYGATIQWSDFDSSIPAFEREDTLLTWLIRNSGMLFPASLALFLICLRATGYTYHASEHGLLGLYAIFSMAVTFLWCCLMFTSTRIKHQKPRLVGFEGFVDSETIEKHLYGSNHGEFALESYLGQYRDNQPGDSSSQDEYPFTLVDTFAKTVKHFRAKSPPVALFIFARDGDMVRGLLCSYDCQRDMYNRQAVLRLQPQIIERMNQVDTLHFSPIAPCDRERSDPGIMPSQNETFETGQFGNGTRTWSVEFAFICVFLMALRVRLAPNLIEHGKLPRKLTHELELYCSTLYNIAFLVAQLPAFVILRYGSMQRLVPHLAILKWFDMGFFYSFVFELSWHEGIIIDGLIDGVVASVFISYVWSWYPLRELPFRLLIWALMSGSAYYVFFDRPKVGAVFELGLAISRLLCLYIATLGSSIIGRPDEVPWLSGYDKLMYSLQASTSKIGTGAKATVWRQRRLPSFRYVKYGIILGISLSSSVLGNTILGPGKLENFIQLSMAVLAGAILWRFSGSILTIMLLLSIPSLPTTLLRNKSSSETLLRIFTVLDKFNEFMPPLTWVTCVHISSTWLEALVALSFSLMGTAIGACIEPHLSHQFAVIFSSTNVILLGLLWGYKYTYVAKHLTADGIESMRPSESHESGNGDAERA